MGFLRSLLLTGVVLGAACGSSPPAEPAQPAPSTTDQSVAQELATVPDRPFVESLSRAWNQLEPRIEAGIANASAARKGGSRDTHRTRLWGLERERQQLEDRARAAWSRAEKARAASDDETARGALVELSSDLEAVARLIADSKPALMQTLAELGPASP